MIPQLQAIRTYETAPYTNIVLSVLEAAVPQFAQLKYATTFDAIANAMSCISKTLDSSAIIHLAQDGDSTAPDELQKPLTTYGNAVATVIHGFSQFAVTLALARDVSHINAGINALVWRCQQLDIASNNAQSALKAFPDTTSATADNSLMLLTISGGLFQLNLGLVDAIANLLRSEFAADNHVAKQAVNTLGTKLSAVIIAINQAIE